MQNSHDDCAGGSKTVRAGARAVCSPETTSAPGRSLTTRQAGRKPREGGSKAACRQELVEAPGRLLVCFAGGLGDLVMSLPLLARAVKQCETTLYAFEGYREWLDLIDLPGLRICTSIDDLRGPFDAAIMTHSTPGAPPLNKLPERIGFAGRNYPFPYHATEANFAAGAFVGLHDDGRTEYPIRVEDASLKDVSGEYIVICPDAPALSRPLWAKKLLPFGTWARVVMGLRQRLAFAKKVKLHVDKSFPVSIGADVCMGAVNGAGLASVLRNAMAVLTVDCGVAHLAAVLGTPTVVAWGPTSRAWSLPIGPAVSVVTHGECGQCLGTAHWQSCATPRCMGHRARGIVCALEQRLACRDIHA